MATNQLPCPTLLRQLLRYEPETGKLFWKVRPAWMEGERGGLKQWNGRWANREAFTCRDRNGYLTGAIFAVGVKAHRAAWAIHQGRWPAHHLDHINRQTDDNRLENLREVGQRENAANSKTRTDNTSGAVGVRWDKSKEKWHSYITVDGRQMFLGRFAARDDAVAARKAAEAAHGFHINHGVDLP